MSINQFSQDIPETLWWRSRYSHPQEPSAHHHYHQTWLSYPGCSASAHSLSFNLNRGVEDDESSERDDQVMDNMSTDNYIREQEVPELDREPLFEKPLTPSDVGKLNRLVIPKQHAEKYFPLGGELADKGLILSFEDESGKCWRFRYSYWSSSQSYVLTKGWSRYVKDKRFDAGDVILFERHRVDIDRLFIGWRRRGDEGGPAAQPKGWTGAMATSTERGFYDTYPTHPGHGPSPVTDCTHPGSAAQNQTASTVNSKTLRLFGVNLECQLNESEPSTPDGSSLSRLGLGHKPIYSRSSHYYSANLHQMDITLTQDVNTQHVRDR